MGSRAITQYIHVYYIVEMYIRHIAEKAVDLHDNARFATIASIWTRISQALELIKTPIAKVSERGGRRRTTKGK